jgi:putative transposase
MKGRPAEHLEGLDRYDFAKLACTEGSARERRRFLAFAHIQDGKSFSDAAYMVKVKPRTVIVWAAKFRQDGIDGLREKSGRGTKGHFSQEEKEAIGKAIENIQQSRSGGRIRGDDVREYVQQTYGVRLSNGSLYRLLHDMGLSWITGRSIHPKADIKEQELFKKTFQKKSGK